MGLRRRVLASLSALAFVGSLSLAAPAFAADPPPPPGAHLQATVQVVDIDPGSYLGVRSGPGYNYRILHKAYNGNYAVFQCWTRGADGRVWDYITLFKGGSGYANDYYLSTGRNVPSRYGHC